MLYSLGGGGVGWGGVGSLKIAGLASTKYWVQSSALWWGRGDRERFLFFVFYFFTFKEHY